MRMTKSIVAMTVALAAAVGQAGDSASFWLDTVTPATSPAVDSLSVSWDAAWIGGDANATVVIADNGTEVRRASGSGDFLHTPTGLWRHDLTYTTYIGGVAQDEVYATTVYTASAQLKYNVVDGCAVITETLQTSGDIVIPSVIDGYPVTEVANGVFAGCGELTSVTIPDSVTSIGNSAFQGCTNLTNVTIPQYVLDRQIRNVFPSSCYTITNVSYSSIITNIGGSAFYNCSGLTSVTIPNGVTSIGNYAFYGCSGLTSVTIPDGVTSIGSYAFYGCTNMTSVTIPDSVTNIGDYAFYGCTNMTSVTIPDSVTNIGDYAFDGCSGLKDATLSSCWVLSSLFPASYSGITNVTVASGSSGITNAAFKGCSGLTSVSIPDTVTSIGDEAFYNCTSLGQLTIPDSVTSCGVNCFEGCPAYTLNLYRAVFGGGEGGGSPSVVTTVVQEVASPYALTNAAADRAIASVTVNADCAIDSFVLKDGKVYDSVLYISNTADHAVTLTLPSGYVYKAIKGATPLRIPANSQSILSITRVADRVFIVSREDLETIQ